MKLFCLSLLLSLVVCVGCTYTSSMEQAKQEARARLYIQELNQFTRQFRSYYQEGLDIRRETLARTKAVVTLSEQALAYKAATAQLLQQKTSGARARAREISAALQSINTRILDTARWSHAKTQRIEELNTQLEALQVPARPDDLPGWAILNSE